MASYILPPDSNPRVPQQQHPFHHRLDIQTRFTDADSFGHINNNTYLSYMDLGKIDYFKTVTGRDLTPADIRSVVVHISIDFFAPAYLTEPLQVYTAITSIGNRSYTIQQRIVNAHTHETKTVGTTILAGFDPLTAQSAPLDPQLVATISAFESL